MGDKSPKNREKKKQKAEKKVTSTIVSSAEPIIKTKKTYQSYEIVMKDFYVQCLKFDY